MENLEEQRSPALLRPLLLALLAACGATALVLFSGGSAEAAEGDHQGDLAGSPLLHVVGSVLDDVEEATTTAVETVAAPPQAAPVAEVPPAAAMPELPAGVLTATVQTAEAAMAEATSLAPVESPVPGSRPLPHVAAVVDGILDRSGLTSGPVVGDALEALGMIVGDVAPALEGMLPDGQAATGGDPAADAPASGVDVTSPAPSSSTAATGFTLFASGVAAPGLGDSAAAPDEGPSTPARNSPGPALPSAGSSGTGLVSGAGPGPLATITHHAFAPPTGGTATRAGDDVTPETPTFDSDSRPD